MANSILKARHFNRPMPAYRPDFHVRPAVWQQDEVAIARLRRAVFINEQGVPEALEWEAIDACCDWFVAISTDTIIGVVRLLADGRIGRMAVQNDQRRQGVGRALLDVVLSAARQAGLLRVSLSAQTHAIPFYQHAGFVCEGVEYLDAGILHRTMYKELR